MRYEAVKNAIAHRAQPVVPYAINLSGEGIEKYAQKLIDNYAGDRIKADLADGRLNLSEAYSLAIGNCVLNVGCPWWNWHSYPEDYTTEEAPSALPYTVGYGSYENLITLIETAKEYFV